MNLSASDIPSPTLSVAWPSLSTPESPQRRWRPLDGFLAVVSKFERKALVFLINSQNAACSLKKGVKKKLSWSTRPWKIKIGDMWSGCAQKRKTWGSYKIWSLIKILEVVLLLCLLVSFHLRHQMESFFLFPPIHLVKNQWKAFGKGRLQVEFQWGLTQFHCHFWWTEKWFAELKRPILFVFFGWAGSLGLTGLGVTDLSRISPFFPINTSNSHCPPPSQRDRRGNLLTLFWKIFKQLLIFVFAQLGKLLCRARAHTHTDTQF